METQNKLEIQKPQQGSEIATTFNFFDPVQFATMQRVCKLFASSELVPDMYKISATNPEEKAVSNCMVAIEMAMRIGASPLMVMQNMVIIYGKPSFSSKFLIATVNACGRFPALKFRTESLGKVGKITITEYEKKWVQGTNGGKGYYKNEAKQVEFDGTELDNIQCVAYTTEKGSTAKLESSPVSIVMALQEGWYTKAGSKWKTMPLQMLMYRAASFWTSAYAPELSMGMKTVEEILDIEDVEFEELKPDAARDKEENANKVTIKMDDEPEDQKKDPDPADPAYQQKTTEQAKEGEQAEGDKTLFQDQTGKGGTIKPGF